MLAIIMIAAIACILLIVIGCNDQLKSADLANIVATLGAAGLLILIVILHAARIGAVLL